MPQVHPDPQLQSSQVQSGLSQPLPLVMLPVMHTMLCVPPSFRKQLPPSPVRESCRPGNARDRIAVLALSPVECQQV